MLTGKERELLNVINDYIRTFYKETPIASKANRGFLVILISPSNLSYTNDIAWRDGGLSHIF